MQLSTLQSKLKLLSVNSDAKTKKSNLANPDTLSSILYLAPAMISGYEVCPARSEGCTNSCLFTAGRGAMSTVQKARIRKTKEFFEDQSMFLTKLTEDLVLFEQYCIDNNMKGYVRLNGTSDIKWEEYVNMSSFNLYFYDYTKRQDRDFTKIANNYKITFSRSEDSLEDEISEALLNTNVAMVFDEVPVTWKIKGTEVSVIEGDLTDLRYEDPKGVIIGLKAKGMAKKDLSGFVIKTEISK